MRIGFLGNSNNYPFMLARALRRAGHDVLFVLNRRSALDRPENRYDDIDSTGCPWVFDAGALQDTERFQFLPESALRDQVIGQLRGCDAVVLNHSAVSLALLIGRPHIGLLTGTDIQDLADPDNRRWAEGRAITERLWLDSAIARQRAGIATAVAVSVPFRGLAPRYDLTLDALGVNDDRRFYAWMSDPVYFSPAPPPQNERVRIFNVARLTWKRPDEREFTIDHKASDVMLRGLARFAERHPTIRLDIRLVRKGLQVSDAEALIEGLGLKPQVTWIEEMTQDEVMEEFRRADIVCEQMGLSLVGMGGLDAMAVGRPLIANARPEVMRHHLPEMPVRHATTVDEVAGHLERLVLNREERERAGRDSRAYIEQHCSADAAAAMFARRLEGVVTNPVQYSLWSERRMDARQRLVEERATQLARAEAELAERERLVIEKENQIAEEHRLMTLRAQIAQERTELVERRTELAQEVAAERAVVAAEHAEVAEKRAAAAREGSELARSFAAYDALRIVRWQRAVKAWVRRVTGQTGPA